MSATPPATTSPTAPRDTGGRVEEFDLVGELPTGTTILEASAGTGKTYAIAGLVLRYVVEAGIALPELLVVTFTRAATAELRDRVRRRLVTAADHLSAVVAGAVPDHDDEVLHHLATSAAGPDELRVRRDRAATAVADFDAATISTIHGFCQQVLRSVGLTADVDPDAELVADQSEFVHAVVDDLLVRAAVERGVSQIKRKDLLEIADRVAANPDARIVPDPAGTGGDGAGGAAGGDGAGGAGGGASGAGGEGRDGGPDVPALRAELAERLRAELRERKRARRQLSYDDLLTQLRDAITDATTGDAVVAALRERYSVALIDEFQDTDPVQWDILRRAFADPAAVLVLIGDPKQAIYSFRGADVHAYLDAVAAARTRRDLRTNWRSDGPLLTALDTLLTGGTFGDPRIDYRTVRPAPDHEAPRLTGAGAPLRLRCVPRSHRLRASSGDITAGAARQHIAADVAARAVELLTTGATIRRDDRDEPVTAGDLAVLVRTNAEAVQVHRALREVRVPAIINGVGSVFDTPAATEWRQLLEALEQPTNTSRARAAALTSFLGWTGEELADATDDQVADLHDRLHGWAQVLRDRGVASLSRTITVVTDLPGRLLEVVGGERHLTDLEHVGQLLHRAAAEEGLGPASLTSWLTHAMADADDEKVPADERARRLESDERAVQILTVHRSKGLQYPIVFAPFLWSPGWLHQPVLTFHDAGGRALDVGGSRKGEPTYDAHKERSLEEHAGELLRLLYVALTRAEHQVVVWWAPCRDAARSGLGRILFARDQDGQLDTSRTGVAPSDDRCRERLGLLVERAGGHLALEETDREPPTDPLPHGARDAVELDAAELTRELDHLWHRTSYSALTARSHEAPVTTGGPDGAGAADGAGPLVGSEREESVTDDEVLLPPEGLAGRAGSQDDVGAGSGRSDGAGGSPVDDASAEPLDDAGVELRGRSLPLGEVPGGTEFGTFVHAVLEDVDFADDDLRGALRALTDDQLTWRRTRIGEPDVLVEGLALAVETPLGPLVGGRRLRDLTAGDRLNELDFELPLDPRLTGRATVAGVVELLREHLPADDPLAGYAGALEASGIGGELRGYLNGSIDLVVRVPGAAGQRYLVADHKTNRLGAPGMPLTAADYRPTELAAAMVRGHYPLQALLYQVALHRYLRWRVPGYDPEVALGGALYLFLRGMAGPDTPTVDGQPCGVFAWQPPASLIVAVSDLFDGGTA
jgi:exodeoxyribonuclease V beta subunit